MERLDLFGYPVGLYQLAPDGTALTALGAEVAAEAARTTGVQISNRGGWQSSKAYFTPGTAAFAEVRQQIFDAFGEFLERVYGTRFPSSAFAFEAWANVNYRGHYNTSHDHTAADNHWSGILYIEPGTELGASPTGVTVFENRQLGGHGRFVASTPVLERTAGPHGATFELVPEAGKLVFFPGTLWHRVDRYDGSGKRITLAFNLRVAGLSQHSFDGSTWKARAMSYMWINYRGLMVLGSRVKHLIGALAGRETLR